MKYSKIFATPALLAVLTFPLQSKEAKSDAGWIQLCNGKDLSGWTANENKDSCKV